MEVLFHLLCENFVTLYLTTVWFLSEVLIDFLGKFPGENYVVWYNVENREWWIGTLGSMQKVSWTYNSREWSFLQRIVGFKWSCSFNNVHILSIFRNKFINSKENIDPKNKTLQKFLMNVSGKTNVMQHVDDKKLYKDFAFVHLLKLFNSSVCNRQLLLHFYVFFCI